MPSQHTTDDDADSADALHDQVILGRALRQLRDRTKLTQDQLAERIGIDLTYVSRVERGKRGVRWHTVMRFLRALDASLADLNAAIEADDETTPRRKR
jgi:transcriptional regulator with XRE-family HTH domain